MADRQARTPERPRPGGFNLLASPNLMLGSGALPLFQPSPHRNTLTSPVKQFSLNGLGSLFGSPTFTSNGDITSELKELMSFPLMTPPRNQQSLPQPQHGLHFADMFAAGLHAHTETGSSRNADAEGFRMGDDGLDFEDSELAAVIFSSPTAKVRHNRS